MRKVSYLHASLYLGDGEVAEAISDKDKIDLKINQLTHENFEIKRGCKNQFHVFRCKSSKMAKKAVKLAKVIASSSKREKGESGSFNFRSITLFPFSDKSLNREAIKRYLKAAFFSYNKEIPVDRYGPRNFHCSYLVMWLYQAAESKYVLKELNRLSISKIEFPDITLCQTKKEKGEAIAQWAKNNRDRYEEELRDLIEINLNAKAISPSDMFNFFKLKSHLFGQVFNVISKESIEEKNSQN